MKKKVYIVGNAFRGSFVTMFSKRGWDIVDTPEEAEYLQFTGGADINPQIYSHAKHPTTSFSVGRDEQEVQVYNTWRGKKKMLGVCRGAQLFCGLNGGTLYQDVNNHAGSNHVVTDLMTGESVIVSSVHHQMMRPSTNAEIIAVSTEATEKDFMSGGTIVVHGRKDGRDPEVVYWKETQSLGFQGHPEFGPQTCENYYFELIERLL